MDINLQRQFCFNTDSLVSIINADESLSEDQKKVILDYFLSKKPSKLTWYEFEDNKIRSTWG